MAKEKQKDEISLFKEWKHNGSVPAFQQLYSSMKPLLYKAAEKASYGSNIPQSAHQIWAAQNFYDALRTYSPNKGTALQTHVFNSVHQKAKRLNYLYQNLGHIPEPRAMQIGLYHNIYENMKARLGREPSPAEISDELGWGIKDVVKVQKEIQKDLSLDVSAQEEGFYESPVDEEILDFVYYELAPEEQLIYDYVFGKHGKPRLVKANNKIDFAAISRRVGFSGSKARALWTKVRLKVQKALHR